MSNLIGLDFETYGAVSLPDHGLERYASDETFRPLIACVAWRTDRGVVRHRTYNFVADFDNAKDALEGMLEGANIAAHNAGFERRVLQTIGIDLPASRFRDSAVAARAAGAGGSLEAAAPQLLDVDKLESGKQLIQLFSIPGKYQEASGSRHFDPQVVADHAVEWFTFEEYCRLDAELSLLIVENYPLPEREWASCAVTMEMNQRGWHVDLDSVREMQRRYLENVEVAVADFRSGCNASSLNLNSLKQLKEWCMDRGIRASSFDEKAVAALMSRLEKKMDSMDPHHEKWNGYDEVLRMLQCKQMLGGSSLKKLQVILDTTGHDSRLRDQYLHIGAGQSFRTTGRSVQMQNLKRIGDPDDMELLFDDDTEWSNEQLAKNLRQVFTATDPKGALVVGDFSSVESRGLAWLAGEQWKLDAYAKGLDLYKTLASNIYGVHYDNVTKVERQTGKVGELSCGYQAGPGAVLHFASNMGVEMSEGEATKLVQDWRMVNPAIVDLWAGLDDLLQRVVNGSGSARMPIGHGWTCQAQEITVPQSLWNQHRDVTSIAVSLLDQGGREFMTRYFHGLYHRGNNLCYYKPSERKTGDLWSSHFTDPKTKQVRFYNIYGGKLAGILTQSFCRELFFACLRGVEEWLSPLDNIQLIGQFHDEIVLDWKPGAHDLEYTKSTLEHRMSQTPANVTGFPMAAEIKHDYRYTK